jgi:hypothetical protein
MIGMMMGLGGLAGRHGWVGIRVTSVYVGPKFTATIQNIPDRLLTLQGTAGIRALL